MARTLLLVVAACALVSSAAAAKPSLRADMSPAVPRELSPDFNVCTEIRTHFGPSVACEACDKLVGWIGSKGAKAGCGWVVEVGADAACQAIGGGPEDPLSELCMVAVEKLCDYLADKGIDWLESEGCSYLGCCTSGGGGTSTGTGTGGSTTTY